MLVAQRLRALGGFQLHKSLTQPVFFVTIGTVTIGTITIETVTLGTITIGTVTIGTATIETVTIETVTIGTATIGLGLLPSSWGVCRRWPDQSLQSSCDQTS